MKWKTYILRQLVRTQNSIGQWVTDWEDIQDIDVMISNNLYTTVANDIVYRVYAPSAVTKFKQFDKSATYRISSIDGTDYDITSVNIDGRYTQLLLKEVVVANE